MTETEIVVQDIRRELQMVLSRSIGRQPPRPRKATHRRRGHSQHRRRGEEVHDSAFPPRGRVQTLPHSSASGSLHTCSLTHCATGRRRDEVNPEPCPRHRTFFYLITHANKQKTPQKGTACSRSRRRKNFSARTGQGRGRRSQDDLQVSSTKKRANVGAVNSFTNSLLGFQEKDSLLEAFALSFFALERWPTTTDYSDFNQIRSTLMLGALCRECLGVAEQDLLEDIQHAAFMTVVCARLRNHGQTIPAANLEPVKHGLIVAQDLMEYAYEHERQALINVLKHNTHETLAETPGLREAHERFILRAVTTRQCAAGSSRTMSFCETSMRRESFPR